MRWAGHVDSNEMHVVMSKDCPECGLTNPHTSLSCDCGYEFRTGAIVASLPTERTRLNSKALDVNIMLVAGVVVLTAFSFFFGYAITVMSAFGGGGKVGPRVYLILGIPMVGQFLACIALALRLFGSTSRLTLVPLWVWLAGFAWQWTVMVAAAPGIHPAIFAAVALVLAIVLALAVVLSRLLRSRRAPTAI